MRLPAWAFRSSDLASPFMSAGHLTQQCTNYCSASTDLAFAHNVNFWIFPVEVLGTSPKTTAHGTLKPAKCFLQCLGGSQVVQKRAEMIAETRNKLISGIVIRLHRGKHLATGTVPAKLAEPRE